MILKTYRAYSMAQALAAVKQHLGDDAIILNTRTFKRGGILGLGARTVIEITATPAEHLARPARPQVAKASGFVGPRGSPAQRAYAEASGSTSTPLESAILLNNRETRLAQARAEAASRQRDRAELTVVSTEPVSPMPAPAEFVSPVVAGAESATRAISLPSPVSEAKPVRQVEPKPASSRVERDEFTPRRFILTPAITKDAGAAPEPAAASVGPSVTTEAPPAMATATAVAPTPTPFGALSGAQQMQTELGAIKDLVGEVLQRQVGAGRAGSTMPQQLFDMYLHLIGQELAADLADEIVDDLRRELDDRELERPELIKQRVLAKLESQIPVSAEPLPACSPDGRPLTIALIGPTGVGKTTTLAKIAAMCKLQQKRSVGLITADTYRIAAVDQLRTYANIIGLPLKVTLTPTEMRQAVHALSDCDVILIDTAGRSQNDTQRLEELNGFLRAADPHEVHLVLSSTASEKVLLQEAEAFSAVGADKLVLTKLDEAVSFGVLVNVMRRVGAELSYVTTGQEVPDHIEPGRAARLAELVVGGALVR